MLSKQATNPAKLNEPASQLRSSLCHYILIQKRLPLFYLFIYLFVYLFIFILYVTYIHIVAIPQEFIVFDYHLSYLVFVFVIRRSSLVIRRSFVFRLGLFVPWSIFITLLSSCLKSNNFHNYVKT
jgi:hypothetical protein